MYKDFLSNSATRAFSEYFKPLTYLIPVSRATLLKERKIAKVRLKDQEDTFRAEMVAQREAFKQEYYAAIRESNKESNIGERHG